jgi:hypothetical protein
MCEQVDWMEFLLLMSGGVVIGFVAASIECWRNDE